MYRVLTVQLVDESLLVCFSPPELALHVGDQCIVEHDHIPEFAGVVAMETREEEPPPNRAALPTAVRRATLHDQSRADENVVLGRMAHKSVVRKMDEMRLPAKLLHVCYSFDRSVLTVAYTSEERMDFRDLARALQAELHARVELKQVGVRDAAAQAGGIASCGRKLCCCTWLRSFAAVGVKMAKTQRLSLNPVTIGGMCGRLKCCLRYEFDTYRALSAALPRDGARVRCSEGVGRVSDTDVLAGKLKLRLEDGRSISVSAAEVAFLDDTGRHGGRREEPAEADDEDTRA